MELKSKEEIQAMTIDEKKLYLGELKQYKAQLEASKGLRQQGAGLKRAAEVMMVNDPTGAFNLMDKAAQTDIDRMRVEQAGRYDPDSVRFKLVSRLNAITGLMAKMDANEPEYAGLVSEYAKIKAELEKDSPSIQAMYASGEVETPPPTNGATYESIQTLINSATKNTFEKVKSQVATDKGAAKLSTEQEKYIDDLLEQKRKQLFPALATDAQKVEKIWDSFTAEEKKGFTTPASLYMAGISNYREGLYGTAIQNFIKAANPGEAVMADDINMANKGQVNSGLLTVLKRIGYDATNDNVQQIAQKLSRTAGRSIESSLKALDTYNLTPAQKQLFIDRYMKGVRVVDVTGMNTTGGLRTGLVEKPVAGKGKAALLAKLKSGK